MHEAKLAKMEAEMKLVFQQKVQEKEAKLKQSEEELYARHREMKEALEKQRLDLEDKKRRIESGRPLTPEKQSVCATLRHSIQRYSHIPTFIDRQEEELLAWIRVIWECILLHFDFACSVSVVLPYLVSYISPFAALHYCTSLVPMMRLSLIIPSVVSPTTLVHAPYSWIPPCLILSSVVRSVRSLPKIRTIASRMRFL